MRLPQRTSHRRRFASNNAAVARGTVLRLGSSARHLMRGLVITVDAPIFRWLHMPRLASPYFRSP